MKAPKCLECEEVIRPDNRGDWSPHYCRRCDDRAHRDGVRAMSEVAGFDVTQEKCDERREN